MSPVLDMLYDQFPECLPFRQPVDPILLQVSVSSLLQLYLTQKFSHLICQAENVQQ